MKTFVLAPDSFKGSATAKEVCEAMTKGIQKVLPDATCICVPMADGGEGTMQTLVDATNGTKVDMIVKDPLGDPVIATYGILGNQKTAVIEMASASGLCLVAPHRLNPLITTTYGTGQLLKRCLDDGFRHILLAIGGSATNDGGAGFAQALGVKLLDSNNREIPFGGAALQQLACIDISNLDKRLNDCVIEVACDVSNPLCGDNGASAIFGPQKGATSDNIKQLDTALLHYADITQKKLGKDIANIEGAGAAGGLGAGLLAFTPATLVSGIELVIKYTGLADKIKSADYVCTGEGKIDTQTQYGKVPWGVAKLAKSYNKPVIAITANIGEDIQPLYQYIDAIFSILPHPMTLDESINTTTINICNTMGNVVRLLGVK